MKPPRDVWFWPERDGVKGFLGTAPLVVAGLNPSKGRPRPGPRASDLFFYRCLHAERLENVHVTDIIKIRSTGIDVPLLLFDPAISQLHRRYFERELRIVRPAVMVVMGRLTLDVLRGWRFVVRVGPRQWGFQGPGGRKTVVLLTVHPGATRWPKVTAERCARFQRDIKAARRLLEARLRR